MKKSEKAQLGRKRSQFLIIGLIVALSAAISAFEWKSYDDVVHVPLGNYGKTEVPEIIDITRQEIKRPPKPKLIKEIIEVEKEIKADELDEILIDTKEYDNFNPEDYFEEIIEPVPEFVHYAEVMPEFEGGQEAFLKFVAKHIKYPSPARRMGIEGKSYIEFIVDVDGTITQVKIYKGIGAGCDEEAVRVIQSSPKWKPGKQQGKPVRVKMVLPVNFKLG